jgi:hypothetical protein
MPFSWSAAAIKQCKHKMAAILISLKGNPFSCSNLFLNGNNPNYYKRVEKHFDLG